MKALAVVAVQTSARGRQALRRQIEATQGLDCRAVLGSLTVAEKLLHSAGSCVVVLDLALARRAGIASLLAFIDDCFLHGHRVVVNAAAPWQAFEDMHAELGARGIHSAIAPPNHEPNETTASGGLALLTALRAAAGPCPSPSPVMSRGQTERARPGWSSNRAASAVSPRLRTIRVIAMGASTGGPKAIETVLRRLPVDLPPVLISQHIAADHSRGFAEQLDGSCDLNVCEAEDGQWPQPGQVLVAPSHAHLRLRIHNARVKIDIDPGPPVHRHRPAIDVMFESVADCFGAAAIGVLLTGMGQDGAEGLKKMHDRGAHTIVQDRSTCVVYGMPKRAQELGGVDRELAIDAIAGAIWDRVTLTRRKPATTS